jgi:hypothetical protein
MVSGKYDYRTGEVDRWFSIPFGFLLNLTALPNASELPDHFQSGPFGTGDCQTCSSWHQGRARLSADSLSLSGSNMRITAALISLNGHIRIRR